MFLYWDRGLLTAHPRKGIFGGISSSRPDAGKASGVGWLIKGGPDAIPIGHSSRMRVCVVSAQLGMTGFQAKALRGYGGASVMEIVSAHQGDAFRVVYTVAFPKAVFVLHAFQKKSKHGIATPRKDLATIRRRLASAANFYRQRYEGDS